MRPVFLLFLLCGLATVAKTQKEIKFSIPLKKVEPYIRGFGSTIIHQTVNDHHLFKFPRSLSQDYVVKLIDIQPN